MKIAGVLKKSGKWWEVEIPLLCLYTQGRTRTDALAMAKDAIETAIDKKGVRVTVQAGGGNAFSVAANDEAALLAFALRQQRGFKGLSVREVAKRLGSSSPNAYSAYESGRRVPSFKKFGELLHAIDESLDPVVSVTA